MKVVVVHNRYRSATSGENRVVDVETAALRSAGHEVVPFERSSDEIATASLAGKARMAAGVVWSKSARDGLARLVREVRPDVVHVHNTLPLLSPSVLAATTEARVPCVVTIHNYRLGCAGGDFRRAGRPCHDCAGRLGLPAVAHSCRGSTLQTASVVASNAVNRRAWRQAPSAYIFISEAQRRELRDVGLPAHRSFVKWNLVPRMAPPPRADRGHVAFLGRLAETKGVDLLMAGWDRFSAGSGGPAGSGAGLRLAIAGDGELAPQVRRWAEGRHDVDVLGAVEPARAMELLAGARAAVVPSTWAEPFGLVVVEAMAAGVPVIASRVGALPELVTDGRDGILFRPDDPADLARVLRSAASDAAHWAKLGEAARETYRLRHDPDANVERLVEIYRFAVANPAWRGNAAPTGASPSRTIPAA